MDNAIDREPAPIRAEARRDALALILSGPVVTALLVAIWAATGAGYFWPLWPLLGVSIALVVALWRAFGPCAQAVAGGPAEAAAPRPR
jgi:hypothetical protein